MATPREQVIKDLRKNVKDATERGNLAQANRALQLLLTAYEGEQSEPDDVTDEQVMAEIDALIANDDILREHIRRRLAEFDASREGVEDIAPGTGASFGVLSPPEPSILFPEGHEF